MLQLIIGKFDGDSSGDNVQTVYVGLPILDGSLLYLPTITIDAINIYK